MLRADANVVRELERALRIAEATGENTSVGNVKYTLIRVLAEREIPAERRRGMEMLTEVRDMCLQQRYIRIHLPVVELCAARERFRVGDFDEAIPAMRQAVDELFRGGQVVQGIWGAAALAEALLKRRTERDVAEAQDVIDSLAKLPDDVSGVVRDIWLVRLHALLAQSRGDEGGYREFRERYRAMAKSLSFEGHMQWAEAME